jgi:hypothetical protein
LSTSGGGVACRGVVSGEVAVTTHQLIAIIALILAVVSVVPIPNVRPCWSLAVAVAVLLLALLQFV